MDLSKKGVNHTNFLISVYKILKHKNHEIENNPLYSSVNHEPKGIFNGRYLLQCIWTLLLCIAPSLRTVWVFA